MNSFERKAFKRKQTSLDGWKIKAKSRRFALRKEKLRNRDLTKSRDMWNARYLSAKKELEEMALISTESQAAFINKQPLQFMMISLCINLVVNCSVSFNAVPKILDLMKGLFKKAA